MNRAIVNTVCKFFVGIAVVVGVLFLCKGIQLVMKDSGKWYIYTIIGVVIPIAAVIATYPLIALCNIEKHLNNIYNSLDEIKDLLSEKKEK